MYFRRKHPLNLALLFAFTLCVSYTVAVVGMPEYFEFQVVTVRSVVLFCGGGAGSVDFDAGHLCRLDALHCQL